ncbi:hypothetical protein RN001_008559 [Aquatica leii]|uniref:Uncharacterized protein n=1 Tax=Aquatica leii TaxID=1421715 RepID=A0AAN7QJ32_9COLE|nr:hypothetical protein RN001_008559 [Aquatica leii]
MSNKPLNKSVILKVLCTLNADNPVDFNGDVSTVYERNIAATEETCKFSESLDLEKIKKFNAEDTALWKYLTLNFDHLFKLGQILKGNESLSVKESKDVKNVFRNIVGVGISSNILPNLPYYSKLPSDEHTERTVGIFTRYQRLTATTFGIFLCLKYQNLKNLILPYYLKWILTALYQIVYCPIKQPSDVPDKNGFTMTQDIYNALFSNRDVFKSVLEDLSKSVHAVTYIRETMMLIGSNPSTSLWLKRAVSSTLTHIIQRPKGMEHLAWAMLDAAGVDDSDDSTKSWKILEIIGKIIMDSRKLPGFRDNICRQIISLLFIRNSSGKSVKPFERLFTLCTSLLYQEDLLLCREVLIESLLKPLACLTNNGDSFSFSDGENVLESVSQCIRVLRALVTEQSFKIPLIETHVLDSVINVIFRIYAVTFNSSNFQTLHADIKVILLRFLRQLDADAKFTVFNLFLFDFEHTNYKKFRSGIELIVEENVLIVRCNTFSCGLGASHKADALICLMQEDDRCTTLLFAYLINCLCNPEKYFDDKLTKTDLLRLEDEVVMDAVSDRKMVVYKLLSVLSENANVQDHINQDPSVLVPYIKTILLKSIDSKEIQNYESEAFQTLFLIVMVLQVLVENITNKTRNQYRGLLEPLEHILKKCTNTEMNSLIESVLSKLVDQASTSPFTSKVNKTEVDKALDDICDPLLPVRGHGLMQLAKLIERKDENALERKQYILNIFQQNLKHDDSFIYLNAIGGLASLADVFPETTIKVLAEEYAEFSRVAGKDGHEVRMKIGEVLVRVVKGLGEMAPPYKAVLLNAFLIGTKDDDYLIRASSLSNLGEICRVLGYKLGTIVSEVLVCVHAVITTDKAAEPRRAAVTVIKQLFAGLEKEMVVFLKDEILPLYRTLKNIYYNDADDVMRLQAQLALEQLNENMKDFVFPNPTLNPEKKIVIMDV